MERSLVNPVILSLAETRVCPDHSHRYKDSTVLGASCVCYMHIFPYDNLFVILFWGFLMSAVRYQEVWMWVSLNVCCETKIDTSFPLCQRSKNHTLWNLKCDAGWPAIVIRGTHHAGSDTVWLRCPIRHGIDQPQPTPARTDTLVTGWTQEAWVLPLLEPDGSHGFNLSIRLCRLI